MARWLIRTFTSDTGAKPVDEWIESLQPTARAAVLRLVDRLETEGVGLQAPFVDYLGDDLWELRARDASGAYRVIYFHWKGRTFGLLHGFTKKTQKTPPQELATARLRHRIWMDRVRKNDG